MRKWLVSVGIGLEIGKVAGGVPIAPLMELHAFLDLLADAFLGAAVGGVEGFVATESTSSSRELAVAVGAGKARVDAEFLQSASELPGEVAAVAIEAMTVENGFVHGAKIIHLKSKKMQ